MAIGSVVALVAFFVSVFFGHRSLLQAALPIDDEFSDSSTIADWNISYPGSAAIDIAATTPDSLTIIPSAQAVWFNDAVAPFLSKTITGDFIVATRVHARRSSDPALPPNRQYHAAGILVRSPVSTPNATPRNQQWISYDLGYQATSTGSMARNTVSSTSLLSPSIPGDPSGEIRVCRLGNVFHLFRRLDTETVWRETNTYTRPDLPISLQVGLHVGAWGTPPDLRAEFEYVRFAVPSTLADCTADISVYAPEPPPAVVDLALTNIPNTATSTVSSTLSYALTYRNNGTVVASGVTITETVPSGTIFSAEASTVGWSCPHESLAGVSCVLAVGNVAPLQVGQVVFSVVPVAQGMETTPTNVAVIADDGAYGDDAFFADNTATAQVRFMRVPLIDMGSLRYYGYIGGLYGAGNNDPPPEHQAEGLRRLAQIQPLDADGNPSVNGSIVMVSIGMSNTTQEFCTAVQTLYTPCESWTFSGQASSSPLVNHDTLVIVNGARGGQTAPTWADPYARLSDGGFNNNYDVVRGYRLTPAGVTEQQVQIAWVKVANPTPAVSLPNPNADLFVLQRNLGGIIRALKIRYPNLQQVFLSSRIYSYNPNPIAYETGFAVQSVIRAQIEEMATGAIDPIAGSLGYATSTAPWIAWGPYVWANGMTERSDGLRWEPSDFEPDNVHPSQIGETRVGSLLLDFFLTSPYTAWFRA